MGVGIHGVVAFLLQFVGGYFVHQTDAAAFLLHVYEHALAFFLYYLERLVQLFAAVATHTAKDVAGGARGVYPHKYGLVVIPGAFGKGEMLDAVALLAEGDEFETAILGGQVHLAAHLDE